MYFIITILTLDKSAALALTVASSSAGPGFDNRGDYKFSYCNLNLGLGGVEM